MLSNWVRALLLLIFLPTTDRVTGMLSSAETIDVIAEALTVHQVPAVVLDPVAFPYVTW